MFGFNDHLKPLRIVNLSLIGPNQSSVILSRLEQGHLRECLECQSDIETLTRENAGKDGTERLNLD
jgi:hypothetical protein